MRLVSLSSLRHSRSSCCFGKSKHGDSQSSHAERKQRLINPADHNACFFTPVLDIAPMPQRAASPPRQESEAHAPEANEHDVKEDVQSGI
jgi:hypothetical protein